jgi:hypothetical protein
MLLGEKDGVTSGHPKTGNTKYGQMSSGFCHKVDKTALFWVIM